MKPKTKSELMVEWASQPDQLKREREVKDVRKAMDDARAVIQDGLTRYVKKKTKARSMAKAEADPFAELEGWESMEQIQDAYGYGEFTCDGIRRIGPEYCVVKEDIESAIAGSCLSIKQVKKYAGWDIGMNYSDMKDLYGWHISDLKIYDRPRPLSAFARLRATKFGYEPVDIERPPQSWFYVEDGR